MATSLYFNNFGASNEQNLIEDLIIESIRMYGKDMYYIPRTKNNVSDVFRDVQYSTYDNPIFVEMYIRNVDGFQGDGEFLSKFGVEVRDQITFTMAQRVFNEEVGKYTNENRPLEGDLIWFTLTNALYQIKYVNKKAIFYQMGALQTYDIVCELYEGNSDIFNTGIAEIDTKYNSLSLAEDTYFILAEDGTVLVTEYGESILNENFSIDAIDVQADNDVYDKSSNIDFIDFTEIDPFSEGGKRI
jgi:hypothetical protein